MVERYLIYIFLLSYVFSNLLYKKSVKKIKEDLDFKSNSSIEIWDLVKEEARSGNNLARFAFLLFCIEILSAFSLVGSIFLLNN